MKGEDGEEKRDIKQFHYTTWPDMKAPEFAAPVLELLNRVNSWNPSDAGPMVVHCRYHYDYKENTYSIKVIRSVIMLILVCYRFFCFVLFCFVSFRFVSFCFVVLFFAIGYKVL